MELSEKVLGTYVVGKLKEQIHRPVLQIGKDSFTKGDLSKEGCYSFKAASNLSYVVNKQLKERKRTRRNLAHVTRIGRMIAKEAVMSAGSS
jgi:hypothetical protein